MGPPVFIGDEVTAAGWRLAGLDTCVPDTPSEAARALARARAGGASLVLLSAEYAAHVPEDRLHRAIASASPPVAIVPDAPGRAAVPDLAARVRSRIGLE